MTSTLDQLDVADHKVLLRLDLNTPMSGSTVSDVGKIQACLPTLTALLDRGAAVIVCSHLGRPAGRPDARSPLAPVATALARLIGQPVALAADVAGPDARAMAAVLRPGSIMMLENLRFDAAETSKDSASRAAFADRLAELADLYVSDAFGVLHRPHASVCELPARLPHAAGYLVTAEVDALSRLTGDVPRPYAVVAGGAKVADKLPLLRSLARKADDLIVGGAMATAFLAAAGHPAGASLLPADLSEPRRCLSDIRSAGPRLTLPTDFITARSVSGDVPVYVVPADRIPASQMALDVGPETRELFRARLSDARTVFWNGPMGVFEVPRYAAGTLAVAQAIADCPGFTVIGGGDTAAAVRSLGFGPDDFGHISTGGGASLEFLAGKLLPGLVALQEPAKDHAEEHI
jgi:phosphoglycerate kinase